MQAFNLKDKEAMGFQIESSDIKNSKEKCSRSLLGKLHGDKIANLTGLRNALTSIWTAVGPFKIRELGVNLFQFVFSSHLDKMRILNRHAWAFDNQYLILQPWTEKITHLSDGFTKVALWVQVWNLPPHWVSKEMEFRFKNIFDNVLDAYVPDGDSKKGAFLENSC